MTLAKIERDLKAGKLTQNQAAYMRQWIAPADRRRNLGVTKEQVEAAYAEWQDVAHHGLNHHLPREKRERYIELRNRYGYELSLCDLVESGGIANAP